MCAHKTLTWKYDSTDMYEEAIKKHSKELEEKSTTLHTEFSVLFKYTNAFFSKWKNKIPLCLVLKFVKTLSAIKCL
jgi:hypothetical protein